MGMISTKVDSINDGEFECTDLRASVCLPLQIIEVLDQIGIPVGITMIGLQEQAYDWNCWVGIPWVGVIGEKEFRLEPVGVCRLGAMLARMRWSVCGIRGGHECARMRWLVGSVGGVHECEQGRYRVINVDPGKQGLYELHIQFLAQEKKAGLRMMYEWMGLGAGKDVTEQFRHIRHTGQSLNPSLNPFSVVDPQTGIVRHRAKRNAGH